tara:strand:+ start:224 stop:571 length:348 start_codon:yes stop_codon:yes gene_type:complete
MILDQKNKLTKLHISVPIWLKDLLIESAEKEGMSVAGYCALKLESSARDTIGVIRSHPVAPIPSVSDVLRNYVEGKGERLIGPCGESWPCEYDPSESKMLGNYEFCNHCGVCVAD